MSDFQELGIQVPSGRSGNFKTQCPQCGKRGERSHPNDRSLSVDAERGLYRCHYCGFKGKVGANGDWRDRPAKVYAKPQPIPSAPLADGWRTFFSDRKITGLALKTYGVTQKDGALKFPYVRDGETVNVKTRYPDKRFSMESGCELILMGLDQCRNADQVILVEGEMDLLACASAGMPHVLSVPNGANVGEMTWMASGAAIFERCHTVVIAVDDDEKGKLLAEEAARRIGKEKCCRTAFPAGCKDPNDVLIAHGADVLRAMVADAVPYPVEGVHWLTEYLDAALALRRQGPARGLGTGWAGVDELYTVAPGQLTVVTGYPGSGKSEWLDNLMVNLATRHGWSFAVYSPENLPGEEHYVKLAEKYLGKPYWPGATPEMSDDDLRRFDEFAGMRFLVFDPERPSVETLIGVARTFVLRHGINGLVIDPWNRLDKTRPPGVSETEHVRDCMAALSAFSRAVGIHVWLMAHPKMPQKEDGKLPVPTPYDISGSAHFFNIADNCLAVYRDKHDEDRPVELHVQKIRTKRYGRLGMAPLDYDRVTGRYSDARV